MSRRWSLTIDAPVSWINANQRRDRRRQASDVKAWRAAAWLSARAVRLPRGLSRVHILAELRFPDRRRRDPHNYYPTLKAVVDGLVDHGLIPDDDSTHLDGPDIRLGDPIPSTPWQRAGQVVLTITEAPDA